MNWPIEHPDYLVEIWKRTGIPWYFPWGTLAVDARPGSAPRLSIVVHEKPSSSEWREALATLRQYMDEIASIMPQARDWRVYIQRLRDSDRQRWSYRKLAEHVNELIARDLRRIVDDDAARPLAVSVPVRLAMITSPLAALGVSETEGSEICNDAIQRMRDGGDPWPAGMGPVSREMIRERLR